VDICYRISPAAAGSTPFAVDGIKTVQRRMTVTIPTNRIKIPSSKCYRGQSIHHRITWVISVLPL